MSQIEIMKNSIKNKDFKHNKTLQSREKYTNMQETPLTKEQISRKKKKACRFNTRVCLDEDPENV
jgi:hypothetical protein